MLPAYLKGTLHVTSHYPANLITVELTGFQILLEAHLVLMWQGSVVFRESQKLVAKESSDGSAVIRERMGPVVLHEDIIGRQFWEAHPKILG